MKTWAALLAALAVLPLLAGCSDDPVPQPARVTSEVTAARLANDTYYAFGHRGGDLDLSVAGNGSAEVVLYGADDQRIGRIGVGAEQARGRFVLEGLDAGELVLRVLSISGTLDLRSNGSPVLAYRMLPLHVERHLLVERDASTPLLPTLPGGGSSVDETLELDLLRAPTDVVAVARATYESIDVRASGRSGLVYDGQSGQGVPIQAGVFLDELPGEFHDENVRDGHLSVHVQATSFSGIVLLEARSYSRARIAEGEAFPSTDVPRFTYGDLPDQPVEFEVREGTTLLYLWQEDPPANETSEECEDPANAQQARCAVGALAHVALFGPDDTRFATLTVPANATLAVPVPEAGTWVAVLLDGASTLGADRVPSDFELRLLDVVETVVPGDAAGQDDGSYGEDRRPLEAAGVVFSLEPTTIFGSGTTGSPFDPTAQLFLGGCDPTAVSVLLDGETIAAWGYDGYRFTPDTQPIAGTLLLGDGELEVAYSDFGRGCSRAGVLVQGYER